MSTGLRLFRVLSWWQMEGALREWIIIFGIKFKITIQNYSISIYFHIIGF